jgi:DNA repair exonuclease SbcCD ATPase subunit
MEFFNKETTMVQTDFLDSISGEVRKIAAEKAAKLKKLSPKLDKLKKIQADVAKLQQELKDLEIREFKANGERRLKALEALISEKPELQRQLDEKMALVDATSPKKKGRGRPPKAN